VILEVKGLAKSVDGARLFNDLTFTVNKGEKIAFLGDGLARTTLFQILAGELEPDSGTFRWGVTMTTSYFPKENSAFFEKEMNLVQWLGQYAPPNEGENFARGFLGKMLFSGEEALKKTTVLSGGERVRCMLSRMMLSNANALILDDPTNHLDLESITALNDGLIAFPEVVLFTSHDHQFIATIANRVIELHPHGIIDRLGNFEDYLEDPNVAAQREKLWAGQAKRLSL